MTHRIKSTQCSGSEIKAVTKSCALATVSVLLLSHGEAKVDAASGGGRFTATLGAAKVDASVCRSGTTPAIAGTPPAIAEEDDESCRRRGQGERGGERESKGADVQYRGGRDAP